MAVSVQALLNHLLAHNDINHGQNDKYLKIFSPLTMDWWKNNLTSYYVKWCMYVTLTHWGQMMHMCNSKLTTIGSDKGLSLGQHQAIIWTNVGILFIGHLRRNFNEIVIEIQTFSFKKMHFKMSNVKWWPFCLSLDVLMKL